jgi:uncharacterized membrane protein
LALLTIVGVALILAGLVGLGYCIWRGFRIRRAGLAGDKARSKLQQLIAINLASVALATFGLMLLFLGLSL